MKKTRLPKAKSWTTTLWFLRRGTVAKKKKQGETKADPGQKSWAGKPEVRFFQQTT
jgi:hypothetical protein